MPYEGPGIYRHYKGGLYDVVMLIVDEETMYKPGQDPLADAYVEGIGAENVNPPTTRVVYKPLTPGSLLEDREEEGWGRKLEVFNEEVPEPGPETVGAMIPRFERETCDQCEGKDLTHVGGGMVVCSTCGSNQR